MKASQIIIFASILLSTFACQEAEILPASNYTCTSRIEQESAQHPKAASYQAIVDRNQRKGLIGVSVYVKDKDGIWAGAAGQIDIASGIEAAPCNRFMIASISKVFTGAVVFALVDEGLLSVDDPVNKWIDRSITDELANANESKISHLLNHTSGIPDFYTTQFELDRINKVYNNWRQEDVLEYAYGKNATHSVGSIYSYSNSNYTLLGMIAESASGMSLAELYEEKIFKPLDLRSGYYGTDQPIPDDAAKGYVDIYDNGQVLESEFLYKDELGIGGDGGVVMNAYDLGKFMEELAVGNVVSQASLAKMTEWFDIPSDWVGDVEDGFSHYRNGFALEYFETAHGDAYGHLGGIDGFNSTAFYFPEDDMTFVFLRNGQLRGEEATEGMHIEILEEMFR